MQSFRQLFFLVLAVCGLTGAGSVAGATADDARAASSALSDAQIEAVIGRLEDPAQRDELIATLRMLAQTGEQTDAATDNAGLKTAAAETVNLLADRVSDLAVAANALLIDLQGLPALAARWFEQLRSAETRHYWSSVIARLAAVLGAGFAAAAVLTWAIRRLRQRDQATRPGMTTRILRLSGFLLVDLLPILIFAAVSYAVLALIDAEREMRLVAVALINASILSRVLIALSAFWLAPNAAQLRLWQIGDETAQYMHHWIRRLSFISIYGFFGLQAALLLGLDGETYQLLLRLLGAVIVTLLLVLIAQNREQMAQTIGGQPRADSDEPRQLAPIRRGLARIWHLVAGLYLLLVYGIWVMQVEDGARFVLQATVVSLAVFAASLLLFRAIDQLFERGLRLSDELQASFPGLERRLNRYFPVLRKALKFTLSVFAVLLIADAWGIDALSWMIEGSGQTLLAALVNIALILALAILLWELASGSIERYLANADQDGGGAAPSPRVRTLLTVGRNALLVVLTLVSTLMILSELGINIAPLLAGAGVVGLAIGFGAQRLVQDVITGVFILFQDLMAVGDVVKLGDKSGVVEALSIRTVRLRDLAGVVHTVPFSSIEAVSNLTREFSFHVFEIGIAYREDVDAVIELLKDIGEELRGDSVIGPLILEPLEVFGLDAFGDSAIVIKGRIKTQPIKQWQVGRAFNRLVKMRFDAAGIEIPFPHRTLYFGQDKDGSAPPAFVQLENMLREAERGTTG
jgi:small conductance mechanosensitive channel